MRLSVPLILLPLAISVGALMVTEPANGNAVDVSVPFAVKWSSVETDPKTVDIVIVNNDVYPRVDERVASGIDTSKGSYTVPGLKGIDHGIGYQVILVSNGAQKAGVLAQSPPFSVVPPVKVPQDAPTTRGVSTLTVAIISATSTGTMSTATSQTDVSTKTELTVTGILTFSVPTGESTTGTHTTEASVISRNTTVVSSTTATELITTIRNTTNTLMASSDSELATSTSFATNSAGSTTASFALPTHSKGSAVALAAPGVVAGLWAGVLSFAL
ncbi:Cell wall beta-glucan synthesis [Penicillium sp. DV-2018c]|nr:Cell wall beta-glucan synthesis [Penicillium sp. DV-2018c]